MLSPTTERVVFVHGRGTSGAAAWTAQHGLALRYDCLFVRRAGMPGESGAADWNADVKIVLESLGPGAHLVAADDGAVPAMMAAVQQPRLVHSLVLVEPACLSLTRNLPATEAFVGLHHGEPGPHPEDAPLEIVPGVPTLVLTGGWEPVYEEVAAYLATTGAVHRQAAGGHRPQDSPEGHRILQGFLRKHRPGS